MSRTPTIEALEAKRTDLLNQLKQIDTAIKAAKERETQKKSKAILDALAARGLLDSDLDTVLAAISNARVPVIGIAKTDQLKAVYGEPGQSQSQSPSN
ncbi:hypothetical protein [Dechloromonas hortensis]|uniref:hypothetical protein n=1 Tax=Dechloromonas hortensis TaxID=337779 RepID=UPI0012925EE2|nr:hypothetical protein [Dechloromonas hortensis]